MLVEMMPYDSNWKLLFEKEAAALRDALQDAVISVLHIGSTSVEGLSAKPIVDILLVVKEIAALDDKADVFSALGYTPMGEYGIVGRRYFTKGQAKRTHQIHAFGYESSHDILRHVAFRDYLKSNPEKRVAYSTLKQELAKKYPQDIAAYCDGKDAFVKRLEKEALLWYWKTKS